MIFRSADALERAVSKFATVCSMISLTGGRERDDDSEQEVGLRELKDESHSDQRKHKKPEQCVQSRVGTGAGAKVADLQQVGHLVEGEAQALCRLDHPQHRDGLGR